MNEVIAQASASFFVNYYLGRKWSCAWSKSKLYAGECCKDKKIIYFSRPITKICTQKYFLDTIAHEIAHALVDHRKERQHHGPIWNDIYHQIKGK